MTNFSTVEQFGTRDLAVGAGSGAFVGDYNTVCSLDSVIVAGSANIVDPGAGNTSDDGNFAAIVAGSNNLVTRQADFIGAGYGNTVSGYMSFIGAGGYTVTDLEGSTGNQVSGNNSFIGAGAQNGVFADESFIGSGTTNGGGCQSNLCDDPRRKSQHGVR